MNNLLHDLALAFVSNLLSQQIQSVTKSPSGLLAITVTSSFPNQKPTVNTIENVDCLLWAIGREPNTEELNFDQLVSGNFLTLYGMLNAWHTQSRLYCNWHNVAKVNWRK